MMADPTRRRRKPARPTRPYLSEWILTQPNPRKDVLLQVFSGTPEEECARKLGMRVEEVTAIAQAAAKEAPLFMEDEYAMAYFSAKTVDEFCRVTGQGEGVYKFLSLRYHKAKPKTDSSTNGTAATPTSNSRAGYSPSQPPSMAEHVATKSEPSNKTKKRSSKSRTKKTAVPKTDKAAATEAKTTEAEPTPPARALDPEAQLEAQRRREARRAARELERARRLSGDW